MDEFVVMSFVRCLECECMFSVNLDDPDAKCPSCGIKHFAVFGDL